MTDDVPMCEASACCGRCARPLGPDAPQGLCLRCLLADAVGGGPGGKDDPDDNSVGSSDDSPGNLQAVVDPGIPANLRKFAGYDLLQEIGRGGMGVVYRAHQRSLGRSVALKLLLFGRFAGAAAEARFRAEAAAAARLRHPGIVTVFETGEHEGQPYLAMEFVSGRDLARVVAEHPLSPRRAAEVLRDIAEAVQHAHEQGLLHRDLKPSNVLMDERGHPRVTDFGLAKDLATDSGVAETLTLSGQIVGSPGFLAPEQAAAGTTLTPAADTYALGAMLYHAVTGRPPFAADSLGESLRQVREDEPVGPRALNPGLPRDLENVILHALRKHPGERYATASEFAAELDRFLHGKPVVARPVSLVGRTVRWARRRPAAAIALTLTILCAIGGPLAAWRIREEQLRAQSFASEARRHLAQRYVAEGLRLVDQGMVADSLPFLVEALALDESDPARAARHRRRLGILFAAAPRPVNIWPAGGPVRDLWFSADGSNVIAWRSLPGTATNTNRLPALVAWSVANGAPVLLPPRPASAHEALAVSRHAGAMLLPWDGGALLALRVDGTNFHQRLPGVDLPCAAAFDAAARLVAVGATNGRVEVWSTPGQEGRALRVAGPWTHDGPIDELALDTGGTRLAVRYGGRYLRAWDVRTGRGTRNLGRFHAFSAMAFSPGGEELLVASRDGDAEIWSIVRDNRRFEFHRDTDITAAAWESHGRLVATGGSDGHAQVWHPIARTHQLPALNHGAGIVRLAFRPDGRQLATADGDGLLRLWDLTPPHRDAGSEWPPAGTGASSEFTVNLAPDETVRLADACTGEPMAPPFRHEGVRESLLSVDGQTLFTRGAAGDVRAWPLPQETRSLTDLRRAARTASARGFDPDQGLKPLNRDEILNPSP